MVDRGLLVVRAGSAHMAWAHYTEAGFAALRWLAAQRQGLDPIQFVHIGRNWALKRQYRQSRDQR
jgi:hypothetical protein